jgi:hypothetical protein
MHDFMSCARNKIDITNTQSWSSALRTGLDRLELGFEEAVQVMRSGGVS